MTQVLIHLSNIHNSSISLGGDCQFNGDQSQMLEFLLQSLEINRQLVAGISSQWDSEEELFAHLQKLMAEHKSLEYQVSLLLNP
ncbi:hypothetical protein [Aquiflexum sp.]|uniref:hypothetical protein n=1 Tax=Aquiflexum sp. TaxID=1872584 RepID=UPI0035930D72